MTTTVYESIEVKLSLSYDKAKVESDLILGYERALFSRATVKMLGVIAKQNNIVVSKAASKQQMIDILFPFFSAHNLFVTFTKKQLECKTENQLRSIARQRSIDFGQLKSKKAMVVRLLPLVSKKTVNKFAILPVRFLDMITNKKTGYIRLDWWFRTSNVTINSILKKKKFTSFVALHCQIWKTAKIDVVQRLKQGATFVPPIIASYSAAHFLDLRFYYKVLNFYLTNKNFVSNSNIDITAWVERFNKDKKRKAFVTHVVKSKKFNNFVNFYCEIENLQLSEAVFSQNNSIYVKPVVALYIASELDSLFSYEAFNWYVHSKGGYELINWKLYYKQTRQVPVPNPIKWSA